jgi:IclR helix-turn-helix domain
MRDVIAHIGNIPVEEWVPFLVPVLALYLYGRRRERRRREAVGRLAEPVQALDGETVAAVTSTWAKAGRVGLGPAHVCLLYPPGPDGLGASELAERAHRERGAVARLLEELEDLGYVELETRQGEPEPRAWLTVEGYSLQYETEDLLIARLQDERGLTPPYPPP